MRIFPFWKPAIHLQFSVRQICNVQSDTLTNSMGRQKALAGYAKNIGSHVVLTCDWRSIARAYGQELPLPVRREIEKCTYVLSPLMDTEQVTSAQLQKEMQKIIKVARNARLKIFGSTNQQSSRKKISQRARINRVVKFYEMRGKTDRTTSILYPLLAHSLDATIATSELVYELVKGGERSLDPGWAWEVWVTFINRLVTERGLPNTVRKDVDSLGKASPFVLMIKELQRHLPSNCRRFTASDVALSQGIWRILRKKISLGISGQ